MPVEAVRLLTKHGAVVAPGEQALAVAQDRLVEKDFLTGLSVKTADYSAVDDLATLEAALEKIGAPAILKTRRFGYDGKGQTIIKKEDIDLGAAWEQAIEHAWKELGQRPSILEGFVDFDFELSVIAARSAKGEVRCYEPARNRHKKGVLRTSIAPSGASEKTIAKAYDIATLILETLDYVGVIGVEFFVLENGKLRVNEIAPRVHNSGHWTLDACAVSQFEQHIRAVAGWPLGDPRRFADAKMENLLGEDVNAWAELAAHAGACVHLYGKKEPRAGRKMGHVTQLSAL